MSGYRYDEGELTAGAARLGLIGDELAAAPHRRFGMEPGQARHARLAAAIGSLQDAAVAASGNLVADAREAGSRLDATVANYRGGDAVIVAILRGTQD